MATSECFIATLPQATDDQLVRIPDWGSRHCKRADFVMDKRDNTIRLLVQRESKNTLRGYQKMLRTNLKNYGLQLQERLDGWVRLFDVNEWDLMKTIASGDMPHEQTSEKTPNTIDSDEEDVAIQTHSIPHCLQVIPNNLLKCN